MADRAPLLNLDSLTEHPTVVIDDVQYALTPPDCLPILSYHRIHRRGPRLFELFGKVNEDLTDAEGQELEQILDELCREVLEAPAEVHTRLTDVNRMAIYQAFLELPLTGLQMVGRATTEATTETKKRTGARSSRGSRASTEATQSAGSPASLSASSDPM